MRIFQLMFIFLTMFAFGINAQELSSESQSIHELKETLMQNVRQNADIFSLLQPQIQKESVEESSFALSKNEATLENASSELDLNNLAARCLHCRYFGWAVYSKRFGLEYFDVMLPSAPLVGESGDTIAYTSVDKSVLPEVVYGVNFHKHPIFNSNPYDVFDRVLASRAIYPNVLLSYQISFQRGYYTLDMLLENLSNNVIQKERVVVTSSDVYFLYTLFYPGSAEYHDYFIQSFMPY